MIAIIGANGFIGRSIQNYIKGCGVIDLASVIMVYFNSDIGIDNVFKKISFIDFVNHDTYADKINTLILVAGNSNRINDLTNFPVYNLNDYQYILSLNKVYKADTILLSSAAVYDGYSGEVREDIIIKPNTMYGISKYMSEMIATYCSNLNDKRIIIYRLMYAYGVYEKEKRLLPIIMNSIKENTSISLTGFNNCVNPISSQFVANILTNTAIRIKEFPNNDVINLSSNQRVTILELVKLLHDIKPFKYSLASEEPLLSYWNSTEKLDKYLKFLNISKENLFQSIRSYYLSIQ